MRRSEQHHNTPDQVEEYLRAALAVTDEIDPPADLRPAMFTAAVNLISGKQLILEQDPPVLLGQGLVPRH